MSRKRKRRLTKDEVSEIARWMNNSPMGKKPTIRQIARRYGVNQPSVVKSLGGWKGIRRGKPEAPKPTEFEKMMTNKQAPAQIEGFTEEVDVEKLRRTL